MVYKKSMKLSFQSRSVYDSARVVSIVSTDCARVELFFINWNYLWATPIQILVTISFLLWFMGWPSVIGFVILLAVGPCQGLSAALTAGVIMKKMRLVRRAVAPITDVRVRQMQEIMMGIRVVKFFSWEIPYMEQIIAIRELELAQVLKRGFVQAQVMLVAFCFPVFAGIGAIVCYVLAVNSLDAAVLFPSLAWFTQLRQPLFWGPQTLTFKADADVGFDRITALLLAAESVDLSSAVDNNEESLVIEKASFRWETAVGPESHSDPAKESLPEPLQPHLHELTLRVKKGALVGIVGAVGSGKSTLLNSIIGEVSLVDGKMALSGSTGLASQQPWIQNATIRDNIVFGQEYNEERYLAALRDAALERDLEILPDGDMTEIGERGINLSGGQKQRVSLARLIYFNPDIALLDDPLSAVDVHVGSFLFQHCIKGALAQKTRLLVTHQLHVLPMVDYLVVLKEGRIVEEGTYEELFARGGEFAQFLASMAIEKHEERSENLDDIAISTTLSSEAAIERIRKLLATKTSQTYRVLMQKEDRATGAVELRIWVSYFISSGFWLYSAIVLGIAFQGLKVVTDYWLAFWVANTFDLSRNGYIGYYFGLGILQAASVYTMSCCFAMASTTGARKLHNKALKRVLRAPLSFFDTTPTGRIMNRFAKDQDGVDNAILDSLRRFVINAMNALSIFIVILIGTPIFGAPLVGILIFYWYVQNHYRKSSREIKRIESVSRSPLFAQIGESLGGLATIKAYRETQRFIRMNESLVIHNQIPYFNLMSATQWLSIRLEAASALVVFFAALFGVLSRNDRSYSAQLLGVTLTYALQVTQVVNFCVKLFIESEIAMNQVERIDYFGTSVEQEAELELPDSAPPKDWPKQGEIEFQKVDARYALGLPLVLQNVNLVFHDQQKIGIVGRTGSGKSTIIQTLFRTIELAAGRILIDGIDIATIGLKDLRTKIGIIPQDPVLFSGTVRKNLDPFGEHQDYELWDALDKASMKEKITEIGGLEGQLQVFGENLSVGQRQLMCLARALVVSPKILIMDEATANVDYETDERIQKCLREELHHTTLITIAHRIHTIMDYDRICVLDAGSVVEFGTPEELMAIENGIFAGMVSHL
ncbi:hypothetical protein HDU91_007522 [Kappamyces sp. JEL0680]|nr:hypothetical protein HDU91_007522 [Kappamyces sp. JEL0680]